MNPSSSPRVASVTLLLIFVALLCAPGSFAFAQAAGSDYTKDLPSVERIKAELKGTDEGDTLARQAAIFNYLMEYTQRIKEARDYRGAYTPGEIRVRTAYSLAAYQIEQGYKKTHTPAEVASWSTLEGRYEVNNARQWIHQLSGAQANAAYGNAETVFHASAKRMYDQQMRENEEAKRRAQPINNGGRSGYMGNDPGSVAIRRCVELGGSQLECLGKGLTVGSLDLLGLSDTPLNKPPSYTGLTVTGAFKSGNGFYAQFSDTTVSLSNCGKLIIDSRAYTLQRNGSQILVHVKNSPSPFSFLLGLDGRLQGPASAEIAGKVITGYRQVWVANPPSPGYYQSQTTTSNQELTPLEAGQYAGQSGLSQNGQTYNMATTTTSSTYVPGGGGGGHYESIPIYAPKTQACSIGTLMPGPPTEVDPGVAVDIDSLAGALYGHPTNHSTSTPDLLAPGIRLAGVYTSHGGLKATFADASVVLDCGQAHVRDKYSVERAGSRIFVHVQNAAMPVALEIQPDGSLTGPASVTVAGRLVTGMGLNDVTYAPHSETCNLGTLTPGESASHSANLNAGSVVPSHNSPVPEASVAASSSVVAPGSASASAPSVRASFRVLIHAEFAAGADPLAGQHVFVMRERMDEALRKLGLPVAAGTTPGRAVEELAAACRSQDCKPIYAALGKYFVASTSLDSGGKATLSAHAATGPYYFFATAHAAKGTLVWDVPANIAAGDNTVVFSPSNAETVSK